jgi:hypothetical protein
MSEINTLINFGQTWMSAYASSVEEEKVKSLCLYNDHIILSIDNTLADLYKKGISERFKVDRKKLDKTFLSIQDLTNDPEIYKSSFAIHDTNEFLGKEFDEAATNLYWQDFANSEGMTLEEFNQSLKNSWEAYEYYKEMYYSKLSVISSLLIYERINEKMPCSLTGFSSGENFVIGKCIEQNAKMRNIPLDTLYQEIEYTIPSLNSLSWDEIFELRGDSRIGAFKQWINGNRSNIENEGLKDIVFRELWDVVGKLKPNILTNGIKATIGNIPLPIPVNPISISAEILDLYRDRQFNRKYAWLLFLYEIRSKASNRANS